MTNNQRWKLGLGAGLVLCFVGAAVAIGSHRPGGSVEVPGVTIDGQGVRVRVPGASVDVGPGGVNVGAPGVTVTVPGGGVVDLRAQTRADLGGVRRLVIEAPGVADLRIHRGGPAGAVEAVLTGRAPSRSQGLKPEVSGVGTERRLSVPGGEDLSLQTPGTFLVLEVTLGDDVHLDLEAETAVGNLDVESAADSLVLSTNTGNIEVRDPRAHRVKASTDTGNLLVHLPPTNWSVEASTDVGQLTLPGPAPGPREVGQVGDHRRATKGQGTLEYELSTDVGNVVALD